MFFGEVTFRRFPGRVSSKARAYGSDEGAMMWKWEVDFRCTQ